MNIQRFSVSRRVVGRLLFGTIAVLVCCSLIGQYSTFYLGHDRLFGFVVLFNVDEEHNIPTFFSSIELLSAAALSALIAIAEKQSGRRTATHWRVLAGLIALISLDEMIALHEDSRVWFATGRFESSAWCFWFALLLVPIGLYFIPFLKSLPRNIRNGIFISGCVYICGALGGDIVDLAIRVIQNSDGLSFLRVLVKTTEETLEMVGVALFIDVLLRHIQENIGTLQFQVTGSAKETPRSEATGSPEPDFTSPVH